MKKVGRGIFKKQTNKTEKKNFKEYQELAAGIQFKRDHIYPPDNYYFLIHVSVTQNEKGCEIYTLVTCGKLSVSITYE